MPFYARITIKPQDSPAARAKKKRVAAKLLHLGEALASHFASAGSRSDHERFVRIATWNLREFGSSRYGGRDYECLYYIAEVISHFELVALQEVREDLSELWELVKVLGPDWQYIATDVTEGSAGNGERMVFLYNIRRVHFRNIAGELTLKEGSKIRAAFGERLKLNEGLRVKTPPDKPTLSGTYEARIKTLKNGIRKLDRDLEIPLPGGSTLELPEGSALVVKKNTVAQSPARGKAKVSIPRNITGEIYRLRFPQDTFDDSLRQFARTPYLLSFQTGWLKLNLCTVHIYYGDSSDEARLEQRRSEIQLLTQALAGKAKEEFKLDDQTFLGVLGDFNIIGAGHPTMHALESNGFTVPQALKSIPGSNVSRDKAYDQIAFWQPQRTSGFARVDISAANVFDYFNHVFTKEDEAIYRSEADNGLKGNTRFTTWRTYKMSDHLPMWVELRTDFSDEYLATIEDS